MLCILCNSQITPTQSCVVSIFSKQCEWESDSMLTNKFLTRNTFYVILATQIIIQYQKNWMSKIINCAICHDNAVFDGVTIVLWHLTGECLANLHLDCETFLFFFQPVE